MRTIASAAIIAALSSCAVSVGAEPPAAPTPAPQASIPASCQTVASVAAAMTDAHGVVGPTTPMPPSFSLGLARRGLWIVDFDAVTPARNGAGMDWLLFSRAGCVVAAVSADFLEQP